MVSTTFSTDLGGFRELDRDRCGYALYFLSIMAQDPRLRGHVLNVGCGERGAHILDREGRPVFQRTYANAAQVDGLDPSDVVFKNKEITEKYHATLEDAPLPEATYDAIVSFYVLEHVSTPARFLAAAHRALKPGGVFYAVTPHAQHPFAVCTHLVELFRIKQRVAGALESSTINTYATYNRLNTRRAIVRACEGLGFSSATISLAPCVQWDTYVPARLRFLPHLYDRLLGSRFGSFAQQLMVKLEKSEANPVP